MPKIIEFEGKQHQFPDDFTDSDIGEALSKVSGKVSGSGNKIVGGAPPPGPVSRALGATAEWMDPRPLVSLGSDLATSVLGHGPARMDAAGRLLDTAKSSLSQNWELLKTGWESLKSGQYADAFQKGVHGAIPVVGPMLNQVTEEVVQGKYPEAIGHTAALAAPGVIKGTSKLAKSAGGPIARELKESAKRSYTRALNPYQLAPSGRLSNMAKKAVEGMPATPTSTAVPGLIERGVIAPTQSSLQTKITSMTDKLSSDLDALHSTIPEGTLAMPLDQVLSNIRSRIMDRFTIQPQGKAPIPTSPESMGGIKLSKQFEQLIRAASFDMPAPAARQTSGYGPNLGKTARTSSAPPTSAGALPPPPANSIAGIPGSTMDMVPSESGWMPIPANLGYGSFNAPPVSGATAGATGATGAGPKFMGTVNASTKPPTSTIKAVDFQILRRFKQAWDRSVSEAGGYTGNDFINNMKRATYREVANAVRDELNTARPDIARVGKEFHFWKTAQDVIDATVERTKSRQASLSQNMMTAAGMAKGGVGVALLLRNLTKLTQSTGWNTTSAVLKDRLANAISNGNIRGANAMLTTMLGSQLRPSESKHENNRAQTISPPPR